MSTPKSFKQVQHEALEEGFFDLMGEDQGNFKDAVVLSDTVNTLVQVAAQYIAKITGYIEQRDVASSGKMSDLIEPTAVTIDGNVYTIGIQAPEYTSFQDEGVEGWDTSGFKGSRFKFKTKGVDPKGEHVKKIKDWLTREGKSAANIKVGISKRETKGKSIDEKTQNAVTVAYMIKRFGIEGKYFWRDATNDMTLVIKNEFGAALKIDIINNLLK